jgi:hypothetical protein
MYSKSFPVTGIFRNDTAALRNMGKRTERARQGPGVLAPERLVSGRVSWSLSGYRGVYLRTIGRV